MGPHFGGPQQQVRFPSRFGRTKRRPWPLTTRAGAEIRYGFKPGYVDRGIISGGEASINPKFADYVRPSALDATVTLGGVGDVAVDRNAYVKRNVTPKGYEATASVGIVAIVDDNSNGGGVRLDPGVANTDAAIYADKAIVRYNGSELWAATRAPSTSRTSCLFKAACCPRMPWVGP